MVLRTEPFEEEVSFDLGNQALNHEYLISPFTEIRRESKQESSFSPIKRGLSVESRPHPNGDDFFIVFLQAFRNLFGERFPCPIFCIKEGPSRFFTFSIPPAVNRQMPEFFFFLQGCFPWNIQYIQRSPETIFLEEVTPVLTKSFPPQMKNINRVFQGVLTCFSVQFSSGTRRYFFSKGGGENFSFEEKEQIKHYFQEEGIEKIGSSGFVVESTESSLTLKRFPEFLRPAAIAPPDFLSDKQEPIDLIPYSQIIKAALVSYQSLIKIEEVALRKPLKRENTVLCIYKMTSISDERTFPLLVCGIREEITANCELHGCPYASQVQIISSSEAIVTLAELKQVSFSEISEEIFHRLGGKEAIRRVTPPDKYFQYSIAQFSFGTLLVVKVLRGETFSPQEMPPNFRINSEKTILNIYGNDHPEESFSVPLNPFLLYSISPQKIFIPNSSGEQIGEALIEKFYRFWHIHVKETFPEAEMAIALGENTENTQEYVFHMNGFIVERFSSLVFLFQKMLLQEEKEDCSIRIFEIDDYSFIVKVGSSNQELLKQDKEYCNPLSLQEVERYLQEIERAQLRLVSDNSIPQEIFISRAFRDNWLQMGG